MIEEEFLHHFITEEIFIIANEEKSSSPTEKKAETSTPPLEKEVISFSPVVEKKEFHSLVLLSKPLTSDDKALLGKILGAIKFDLEKVPVVENLNTNYDFSVLISFGIKDPLVPELSRATLYSPISAGQKSFLLSSSISDLHGNDSLKKQLWAALQQIFISK